MKYLCNCKRDKTINTMENTKNIQLSEHFTLWEMTRSGAAIRHGIDNTPDAEAIESLRALCLTVLEPLRRRYGRIIITSGYRCQRLNRVVGGQRNSQHLLGEAADIHITSPEMAQRYASFIIRYTDFDQLIYEPAVRGGRRHPHWLHVSHTTRRYNRHQVI